MNFDPPANDMRVFKIGPTIFRDVARWLQQINAYTVGRENIHGTHIMVWAHYRRLD